MLYNERKRLQSLAEREAQGESFWTSSFDRRVRQKLWYAGRAAAGRTHRRRLPGHGPGFLRGGSPPGPDCQPEWCTTRGYADQVQVQLRRDLVRALRTRDEVTAAALRSALAALANAEAVDTAPADQAPVGGHPTIAGSLVGVGAAEVDRRELTAVEMEAILRAEVAERVEAAAEYRRLGHNDRAIRLEEEADVVRRYLPGVTS